MKLNLGKFLSPKEFQNQLRELKIFGTQVVTTSQLEQWDRLNIVKPKMRVIWPDAIARRIWMQRKNQEILATDFLNEIEPDGPRWEAGVKLWCELERINYIRSTQRCTHPLEKTDGEYADFLFPPEQQSFRAYKERQFLVSVRSDPHLKSNLNARDYYNSWQILQAYEGKDLGVFIPVNLADDECSSQVVQDIKNGLFPSETYHVSCSAITAAKGFHEHEAALDAIVGFDEESRYDLKRALGPRNSGRYWLSSEENKAFEDLQIECAKASMEKCEVQTGSILVCLAFLAKRYRHWDSMGHSCVATAYRTFLEVGIQLLKSSMGMGFDDVANKIELTSRFPSRQFKQIWPNWESEQLDRLNRTLRSDLLTKDQIDSFGHFLIEHDQDVVLLRLESFEKHVFTAGPAQLEALKGDLQSLAVAVEQVFRRMGADNHQIGKQIQKLWRGSEIGQKYFEDKNFTKYLHRSIEVQALQTELEEIRKDDPNGLIAADLITARQVRGAVHHSLEIDHPFALEELFVSILRAAALTHAHVFSSDT